MIFGVIITLATAYLLYLGHGLIQIVELNVFVNILMIITLVIIVKKLASNVKFVPIFNMSVTKKILKYGILSIKPYILHD